MDTTTEKIFEIIRAATNSPNLKMSIHDKPGDLSEWDSLSHIKIISKIEDYFEIRFSLRELSQIKRINDLIEFVRSKKSTQA